MVKKHNININFVRGPVIHCDRMSKVQIKNRLEKMADLETVPNDSCVYSIYAKFIDTTTMKANLSANISENVYPIETSDSYLDIVIIRKNYCKCSRYEYECIRNLESGKCTDEFMIKSIGKNFFPNEYKNTKTKQR